MKTGKVLALDYGSKRIGIASGDLDVGIAFPRDIIENKGTQAVLEEIFSLCEELEVKLIVVGLPLKMKDEYEENKIMKDVVIFVDALKSLVVDKGIVVEFLDERLSSFEAGQLLKNVIGENPGGRAHIDAHAAQIILQRYFDKM